MARGDLPPSAIAYEAPALSERLQRGEHLFHRYDLGGYRILEAACLAPVPAPVAWRSIQRFPEIWSRLATTGGEHRLTKARADAPDIAVGNVIRADAVIFGIRFAMENVVTAVREGIMFHMSVRALGGFFESEVEAIVRALSDGTLLVWRQAYPRRRLASALTSRLLVHREAAETRRILEQWAATLGRGA